MEYRDSQTRHYDEGQIYFVTCNVKDWAPFFKEKIFCELFVAELKLAQELKEFELYGFCLNYSHFHLLIKPNQEHDLSKIMQFLKRNFSRCANFILGYNNDELKQYVEMLKVSESDNNYCRFQKPQRLQKTQENYKKEFQEFNKKLLNLHHQFIQKHSNRNIPKFHWQKSFRDHVIRDRKDFENHHQYAMYNFLKHNLPQDWPYTSLNYPAMITLEIMW
ncbi:MAG: transposase [Patescibacteria group bacterium]